MSSGGKRSTTWPKGKKPPFKKPKGSKHKRTILKEKLGVKNWAQLVDFIETKGLEKCVNELSKLNKQSYVSSFISLTEFVKPKIRRTELLVDKSIPLNITSIEVPDNNR